MLVRWLIKLKSITAMPPEDVRSEMPRRAVRAIILSPMGNVLLIQGKDSRICDKDDQKTWWFTPGGGISESESEVDALKREIYEETGFHIDKFSRTTYERTSRFVFEDKEYFQHETFFVAHHEQQNPSPSLLTALEKRTFINYKWWSPYELNNTNETIYPPQLAQWISHLP